MSMLRQEAKNALIRSNNRSLINFIQQRAVINAVADKKDPLAIGYLLEIAYEEVQKRQAQEFKALFSGKSLKDEPIQDIIDQITHYKWCENNS